MNITIELSQKSVKEAQRRLRALKKKYPWIKREFVKRSLDFIETEARKNIIMFEAESQPSWYTPKGDLLNSWRKNIAQGLLENVCDHAAWYEYGTGIVGAGTHPNTRGGYLYDTSGNGASGWVFFAEGDYHWTAGMKAHPYLHNAINTYIYSRVYRKIFQDVVAEVEKVI